MEKIAHLALGTPDLMKTANFYKQAFGLTEAKRTYEPGAGDNPPDKMVRRLHLFDGYMNLTICKVPVVGMYHFGFLVDSMHETRNWLEAAGGSLIAAAGPQAHNHEFKYKGPEGVTIDLSERGWPGQTAEGVWGKLQHIALGTPDVVKTANFYKEVFGLYEVMRTYEPGAGDNPPDEMVRRIFLWDNYMNLTICKVRVVGLYHFGFVVDNMDQARKRVEAAGGSLISSAGPQTHHHEFKYKGPQGVTIDLSTRGWGP